MHQIGFGPVFLVFKRVEILCLSAASVTCSSISTLPVSCSQFAYSPWPTWGERNAFPIRWSRTLTQITFTVTLCRIDSCLYCEVGIILLQVPGQFATCVGAVTLSHWSLSSACEFLQYTRFLEWFNNRPCGTQGTRAEVQQILTIKNANKWLLLVLLKTMSYL
jgi:hypothetical protein